MKKGIIITALVAGAIAAGIAVDRGSAEDQQVVDATVDNMDAAAINAAPTVSHVTVPDLTPEVVAAIVEDLKDIEAHNGLTMIAHMHKVSIGQVKMIRSAVAKRRVELAPVEVGELPK